MLDRFADPTTPPAELLGYLFPSGANEAVTRFVTEYASIPQTTISAETLRRQVEARRLAQRIPGAKLELFDGAGHAMMFQDVERFVQVVRDFVG
jgi:pimeloyl-ACP methyl ester carboxylesterase